MIHNVCKIACLSLLLGACHADTSVPPWPEADDAPAPDAAWPAPVPAADYTPPATRERLPGRIRVAVVPDLGRMELTAAQAGTQSGRAVIDVRGGHLVLGAGPDGELAVEDLSLLLGDVVVPTLDGDGPLLTGIRVVLGAPALGPAAWSDDGDSATVTLEPELVLEWGVVGQEGRVAPLPPQRLRGITLELRLETRRDGRVVVRATGRASGVFWSWAELVSFSDATLTLELAE